MVVAENFGVPIGGGLLAELVKPVRSSLIIRIPWMVERRLTHNSPFTTRMPDAGEGRG